MQTVPSLVGTGSAVAAATTGLIFGQLADEPQLPSRASSSRRKSAFSGNFSNTFPSSRPGTTSSAIPIANIVPLINDESYPFRNQQPYYHPPLDTTIETPTEPEPQLLPRITRRPSSQAYAHSSRLSTRRPSTKQGDALSPEDTRDSISSNGSWIRRLSIRPLSQHESLRSSIGPDSPSVFSHNSGAPILGFTGYTQPQLPPNKLVKRASTRNGGNVDSSSPRGSRSQMTLRRPATSHQRSATLQQQIEAESLSPLPKFSSEHQNRPRAQTLAAPRRSVSGPSPSSTSTWKSFWHSRLARLSTRNTPLRLGDSSAPPNAKRICVEYRGLQRVYLITPNSVMPGCVPVEEESSPGRPSNVEDNIEDNPQSNVSPDSPEATPSKQPRRSISLHFSSPSSWLSKAGSIKRRKRGGGDSTGENKRHVSAPVSADTTPEKVKNRPATAIAFNGGEPSRAESDLTAIFRPPNTTRNPSPPPSASPLPPLNRLSSFHIDLSQLRSTSPTSPGRPDNLVGSTATRRVHSGASQARTLDRSSTIASSEYYRGFASSGDDDTDFKTDTPWDSLRTTASGRRRTVDSPAESMFDESPPSTAGNNTKRKRLSIQEILGPLYDGGNKIMEEDENLPTPIRGTNAGLDARFLVPKSEPEDELKFGSVSPEFTLSRDPRISFDDDDDFDWAREDESQLFHHLSPPSSMNSRRGSPSLRIALANISGNNAFDPHHDTASERPRSTIFDWTEPTHHDKHDGDGYSFRPKTVHGKQEIDLRGGRPNRKGPTAAHVRSQSVPAVPDPVESSKSTPKFGTWGLGTKNVSEDWDDDFEFEEETDFALITGKKQDKRFSMVVPASIQATQPTVKAHSGQIRELSLLVNDLKRLCRLGREMDMLRGSSAMLWREAGDIIALASPDEDSTGETTPEPNSRDDDPILADPRFSAQGFDGTSLDDLEYDSRASPNQKPSGNHDQRSSRRRSVFSPEDDIFGNWDQVEVTPVSDRPVTPDNLDISNGIRSPSDARSVMAAMRSQTPKPSPSLGHEPGNTKLNFDTNSLKELVKQASELRDALSDLVRKADCITQSPARTPRRDRNDGSPAFTRVFDGPTPSPTRRLPQSHSSSSVLSGASVAGSPSNGLNQRMQMMTVK